MAATAKKRRTPTAAQKAAAEERREKFRALAAKVAEMSDEQRAEIAARMPVVTVEGRAISEANTVLLSMQTDTPVTMIGGYRQWLGAGRQVRKGEKALMIWIPSGRKGDAVEGDDEDGSAERVRFIAGNVFDVSQTDTVDYRIEEVRE